MWSRLCRLGTATKILNYSQKTCSIKVRVTYLQMKRKSCQQLQTNKKMSAFQKLGC